MKSEFRKLGGAVNHPDHYDTDGIECIDAIKAALTPDEFRGFIKGNVLEHIWRERLKGGAEDLAKAQWYLSALLQSLEGEEQP
jgi:hypothetical protein